MPKKEKKKLYRYKKGRMIAGICEGIARYSDIDPTIIRLIWVVITVFTGFIAGIIAYLIAWLIIPEKK